MRRSMNLKHQQRGLSKLILIIIVVVLALVGTGAGLFFAGVFDSAPPAAQAGAEGEGAEGEATAEGEEGDAQAVSKVPKYLPIEPPIIVNFDKNGRAGYLQVTVQLMSYDGSDIDNAINNMPVIRNNLLLLFSAKKYDDIKDVAGKEKLRGEVLAEVNKIIASIAGKATFENVYFTSFVMQ